MGQADWTELSDNALQASIPHGVIAASAIGGGPPGGGTFVYAANSAVNSQGTVALYTAVSGFSPVTKGCDVRGALQRGLSGGPSGYSAFLFAQLQGTSSLFNAYMLGLADGGTAAHIILSKAPLSGGLVDAAPGTTASGTLARSTATYAPGTWVHLRLEVVLNTNGDVVLNCYQNDLTAAGASVATPIWNSIPGISQIIDDAVGANLSNLLAQAPQNPLSPGFLGYGMQSTQSARRTYFSWIQTVAQL
jgi:hypothetical protein